MPLSTPERLANIEAQLAAILAALAALARAISDLQAIAINAEVEASGRTQ